MKVLVGLVLVVIVLARNCEANFVAYDDEGDKDTTGLEEYVNDEEQKRADYHDAIDRLISHALNETHHPETPETDKVDVAPAAVEETERDVDLTCAAGRSVGVTNEIQIISRALCCRSLFRACTSGDWVTLLKLVL